MSVEQQQAKQQENFRSVDRLEAALKQLGFALEKQENQTDLHNRKIASRMKALSERVKTLETRIASLLAHTDEAQEER